MRFKITIQQGEKEFTREVEGEIIGDEVKLKVENDTKGDFNITKVETI